MPGLISSGRFFDIPANGIEETLKNIAFEDIRQYYDAYITSEGGRIVIVGDVKENEVILNFLF